LSSPPDLPKPPNPNKTKEKKVENNWRFSFTQSGKIELEGKTEDPAIQPGLHV
jgi:hypothetical protein